MPTSRLWQREGPHWSVPQPCCHKQGLSRCLAQEVLLVIRVACSASWLCTQPNPGHSFPPRRQGREKRVPQKPPTALRTHSCSLLGCPQACHLSQAPCMWHTPHTHNSRRLSLLRLCAPLRLHLLDPAGSSAFLPDPTLPFILQHLDFPEGPAGVLCDHAFTLLTLSYFLLCVFPCYLCPSALSASETTCVS